MLIVVLEYGWKIVIDVTHLTSRHMSHTVFMKNGFNTIVIGKKTHTFFPKWSSLKAKCKLYTRTAKSVSQENRLHGQEHLFLSVWGPEFKYPTPM